MGVSKFAWTDGGAQSMTLDMHLQNRVLGKARPKAKSISLDGSVFEVITYGSAGLNEAVYSVRYESKDTELRDLIDALDRGISMTLTPDMASPGTTFTVTAVEVDKIALESEGRQNIFRVATVRLRRLDGGAFP